MNKRPNVGLCSANSEVPVLTSNEFIRFIFQTVGKLVFSDKVFERVDLGDSYFPYYLKNVFNIFEFLDFKSRSIELVKSYNICLHLGFWD